MKAVERIRVDGAAEASLKHGPEEILFLFGKVRYNGQKEEWIGLRWCFHEELEVN